jgi:hypothetical protein
MTFEETLRDRLERDAASVPPPPRTPGRAVARARARHRHRVVAAGVVAVLAVGTAVAVPTLLAGDTEHTPSVELPATPATLPPTGPLDLTWRPTSGGIMYATAQVQDGDTVYAISTGPGFHYGAPMNGTHMPIALYRLGDDGRWQPTPLDGDQRPYTANLATADGALYAVSTAPGSDVPRVGVSRDGGATWSSHALPPAGFPEGTRNLTRQAYGSVAARGDKVLALVVTRFYVDDDAVFPEKKGHPEYVVERRPEGLVLSKFTLGGFTTTRPAAPGATTTLPAGAPTTGPGAETSRPPILSRGEREAIRTVPWSKLGLRGPDDLAPRYQLFERSGDEWRPVDIQPADLGVLAEHLSVAGDRFVLTGIYARTEGAFVSDDGHQWNRVPLAKGEKLVGASSALVRYPQTGTTARVSVDGGASWTDVDLGANGADPGLDVIDASGGPLGVALLLGDAGDHPIQLAVSSDMISWTVQKVSDVVGAGAYVKGWTFVGADRIVVAAERAPGGNDAETITAVGTPVRR